MKNLSMKFKSVIAFITLSGLSSTELAAQETNSIASTTGIADSTLLFLMLASLPCYWQLYLPCQTALRV